MTDHEGKSPANLDFYLPSHDLYLEIKGGHSERIAGQMARHPNVIAIQGVKSVAFVVNLLANYQGQQSLPAGEGSELNPKRGAGRD